MIKCLSLARMVGVDKALALNWVGLTEIEKDTMLLWLSRLLQPKAGDLT